MKKKPTTLDLRRLLNATFKNTGINLDKPGSVEDIRKAIKIMDNSPALKSMLRRMGYNVK